jgi:uncharacterized membrane protein YphA (DoxX/SURF4 family)
VSPELSLLLRIGVGVSLVVAGAMKLRSVHVDLAEIISAYVLVPRRLAPATAWIVPYAEILLGLALVAGLYMPLPSIGATVLLLLFALALTANVSAGRRTPCACFGVARRREISWMHVGLTAGLAAVAWLSGLWSARWPWPQAWQPAGSTLQWETLALLGLAISVGSLLVIIAFSSRQLVRIATQRRG